ncbi:hypothetical protein LMG31506_05450 [Cupriavidus yeoncheonensis]|uniref:Uncharacterized protein n=1 Tax=Cupriavidus yeoncheonensis TaxID=1462994 RepID=A0A916IZA3_9BURK|nr:hypothetical protein [Cupriavidus yeoncheonensis]CAG2155553.1 hypothetical protein LMG31506_05450 [Cupriavidus yeoncheonensis]
MTLIVAHADQDIGFMVADTLLSSSVALRGEARPVSGTGHTLKIHVLSGQVAVAFAGDPGLACELIAEIKNDVQSDETHDLPRQLLERYVVRAAQDARRADFLVLRLLRGGKALDKVTLEDGVQRVTRAYIGDAEGYRELTRLIGPYEDPQFRQVQLPDGSFRTERFEAPTAEQWFIRVSDALESLCHKRSVATVGAISDAITRVVDARISGELEYMQAAYAGRSVEEGYTGYTLLAANTSPRAMAIYFYAGGLGFVFLPGDPAGCQRLLAETDREFIEHARREFGIDLSGPTMHC